MLLRTSTCRSSSHESLQECGLCLECVDRDGDEVILCVTLLVADLIGRPSALCG